MSRFDLLYEIKRALERAVDLDDLLAALFADHPDLQTLEFEVTNEYDDNNYSDYTRLQSVNGLRVDYEGNYEEEDDEDGASEIPKASEGAVQEAMNLCDFVKEKHGYGSVSFERCDYDFDVARRKMKEAADLECAIAFLKGEKPSVDSVVAADSGWWSHYAEAHGRFSPEDEFKVFARDGWMGPALTYAQDYGPLSEKTLNYFILTINAEHYDYESLQEYLEWAREKAA